MKKQIKISKFQIVVTLAVVFLVSLLYWAYGLAPKEANSTDKINYVVYENNVLKDEENGVLLWELKVGKMSLNPVDHKAKIENVEGTFYGKDGRNIKIEAQLGEYDEINQNVKFTQGLKLTSNDNLSFTTKELIWDNKQRTLKATGGVEIRKPGLVAKADEASSKDNFKSFRLQGNAQIIKGE